MAIELIARLRNWGNYGSMGVDDWIRPYGVRDDVIAAAAALAAQAQKIEALEAMAHELSDDLHEARCELAGLDRGVGG